ncbi:MAG: PadR family transcriptional regulator [Dehalococcoidales bacterium]|jgi:PadR family transcriptional regulator PadR|nr:PadR family transcriptional regulator [Dehalococcoidales bacterium]
MDSQDTELSDRKFQKDLNAGISALILLIVLSRATEPMYGYQIAKFIKVEDTSIKQGTLYPVLRTLETSGLLESTVEPSVSGPPRRYYRITQAGRDTLERWIAIWQQIKFTVDSIIDGGTS